MKTAKNVRTGELVEYEEKPEMNMVEYNYVGEGVKRIWLGTEDFWKYFLKY